MTNCHAVELAQQSHYEVLRTMAGCLLPTDVVAFRHLFPRGRFLEFLCIDDHVSVQILARAAALRGDPVGDTRVFGQSHVAYDAAGLDPHPKKCKRNLHQATLLGADIDGVEGFVSAQRDRTLPPMLCTAETARFQAKWAVLKFAGCCAREYIRFAMDPELTASEAVRQIASGNEVTFELLKEFVLQRHNAACAAAAKQSGHASPEHASKIDIWARGQCSHVPQASLEFLRSFNGSLSGFAMLLFRSSNGCFWVSVCLVAQIRCVGHGAAAEQCPNGTMLPLVVGLALVLLLNCSWIVAVVIVVALLLFFVVNLIMRQESMLYVPCVMPGMQTPSDNPEGMRSPADRQMKFEDVFLETVDGLRIHAWFLPAGDDSATRSAPTLLFCHANAGNIGLRIPNFEHLIKRLQVNVFALDYRGYGQSEGTPSEEGLIEDALCAWRWLQKESSAGRIDAEQLFVFGRSLGGAVTIALASELQKRAQQPLPRGLILENTFTSISDVVNALFPILAFESLKKRFLRIKWESIQRVPDLEVPMLFLTGEKDEMIPPSHSRHLHARAEKSRLKRQVVFPEGHHNDTWEKGGEEYWEVQATFLQECLSQAAGSKKVNSEPVQVTETT
ncbi:WAV2 [Symbiodinium necroappetens]|uniref:WAV2 protein n=1 Tax=Symbiodinium necroappetens TaxID=1628268 RepID=A0A812U868_9DINO|nr:WAV2 [Symbiodinium necroappetens]